MQHSSKAEDALRPKNGDMAAAVEEVATDFNNLLQIIRGNLCAPAARRGTYGGKNGVGRLSPDALTGTDRAAALTQRLLHFTPPH